MANISTIKLPDNSSYNIQDNSTEKSSHIHDTTTIVPIQSKTYSNVYCSGNSDPAGFLYFGHFVPTSANQQAYIKFRVIGTMAGVSNKAGDMISIVEYCTYIDSMLWYQIHNGINNTSYRNWYNHCVYRATAAGITNGYGHLLGFRFYSSYNPNSSTYARTITIDILEIENATFTFEDTMILYANAPGTGSTNYSGRTEYDGTSQGDKHTGDNNTVEDGSTYFSAKTGAKGIWATSLFMEDGNGTYQNICTAADGTVTSNNRTTATTKIANTNGFKVGGNIFYTTTNYAANSNITGWLVIYTGYSTFDSQYSFNTSLVANSLTPYAPVYLVGTIHSDGLFYLDSTWWTQTPTDISKVYVLVGGCYDSTTSNCRITLYEHNPWYIYNGTTLEELKPYWANLSSSNTPKYGTAPEVASIKINGNSSAAAASSENVSLIYNSTTKALDFIFV